MAIPEGVKANFNTLLRAAEHGDLALMECKDADTGATRYVICAVSMCPNGDYAFVPFGHMESERNPFSAYVPPEAE